jgi:hypothetical protein
MSSRTRRELVGVRLYDDACASTDSKGHFEVGWAPSPSEGDEPEPQDRLPVTAGRTRVLHDESKPQRPPSAVRVRGDPRRGGAHLNAARAVHKAEPISAAVLHARASQRSPEPGVDPGGGRPRRPLLVRGCVCSPWIAYRQRPADHPPSGLRGSRRRSSPTPANSSSAQSRSAPSTSPGIASCLRSQLSRHEPRHRPSAS